MKLEVVASTHPGRDPGKQVNEDSSFHGPIGLGYLAIVCDGMGGHRGGKDASTLAVATIVETLRAHEPSASARTRELLREAIERANERVYALGGNFTSGRPGSTVVLALFCEDGMWTAHVGDSRLYRSRGDSVEQITRDHSAVRELVDRGLLTWQQAKTHPEANKITRALGVEASVEPEVSPHPIPFSVDETFVMCSDGLSDLVDPADMLLVLRGADLSASASELVDLANRRGGHDNITVLLARTEQASRVGVTAVTQPQTEISMPNERPQTELMMPAEPRPNPTVVMGPPLGVAPPLPAPPPSSPAMVPRYVPHPAAPQRIERNPLGWIVGLLVAILLTAVITTAAVLHFTGALGQRSPLVSPSVSTSPLSPSAPSAPPSAAPSLLPSAAPEPLPDDAPVPSLAPVKPQRKHHE